MSRILAVDLGGSTLKAGLLTVGGIVEASTAVPVGFDEDATGRSERHPDRHPDRWWRGLTDAVEALAARGGLDALAAIVACGATRTQVFLDAEGSVRNLTPIDSGVVHFRVEQNRAHASRPVPLESASTKEKHPWLPDRTRSSSPAHPPARSTRPRCLRTCR